MELREAQLLITISNPCFNFGKSKEVKLLSLKKILEENSKLEISREFKSSLSLILISLFAINELTFTDAKD